nr:ABC transporter ATP-binding protein [Demetria terragena]
MRTSTSGLPVATPRAVTRFVWNLLGERRGMGSILVIANLLAATAGLLVPFLLGRLVDDAVAEVDRGTPAAAIAAADEMALVVLGVAVTQAAFTFLAKSAAAALGQGVLAGARERIMRDILHLPLSRVETATSGDLVTRVTRDAGTMSESVTWALPESVYATVTVVLTLIAMLLNSWVLALASLIPMALSLFQIRRYLERAPAGYLTEAGTYAQINTTLTETVSGARTVEALNLTDRRLTQADADIAVSSQAERYTLTLRNLLFGVMDLAFSIPRVLVLAFGAFAYAQEWVSIGQITTALLYAGAIWGPFETLVHTVDRVQTGLASTARLLGISTVPPDREVGPERPTDTRLTGRSLRYAYRENHDVLHDVDLDLRVGERLAIVGPSGSGKSTLGRLLAGIHGPRTGHVQVGGVELTRLPLDQLRREVALVTQEHHIFIGTIRDNLLLGRESASDAELRDALAAVGARTWVEQLTGQLDTTVGSGHLALTPGQAQQVALARLVLADPHTIVLDEATSLIDPRTARHLEGSMNALLTGRTVVAIAHRLHTAHDADRIAVMIDGHIAELGSHDELMANDGEYAALWRAWTS